MKKLSLLISAAMISLGAMAAQQNYYVWAGGQTLAEGDETMDIAMYGWWGMGWDFGTADCPGGQAITFTCNESAVCSMGMYNNTKCFSGLAKGTLNFYYKVPAGQTTKFQIRLTSEAGGYDTIEENYLFTPENDGDWHLCTINIEETYPNVAAGWQDWATKGYVFAPVSQAPTTAGDKLITGPIWYTVNTEDIVEPDPIVPVVANNYYVWSEGLTMPENDIQLNTTFYGWWQLYAMNVVDDPTAVTGKAAEWTTTGAGAASAGILANTPAFGGMSQAFLNFYYKIDNDATLILRATSSSKSGDYDSANLELVRDGQWHLYSKKVSELYNNFDGVWTNDTENGYVFAIVAANAPLGKLITTGLIWYGDDASIESGVETISSANGAAQYFNLQGIRVANPTDGQLVIKVQDGKASKVIF